MPNTQYEPLNWRVTRHASGLLKIETRERVVFDGFNGEERNAYLAAAAPQLREALILCMHKFIELGLANELPELVGPAIRNSFPPPEEATNEIMDHAKKT